MTKTQDSALVPIERIAHSILILRGQRVIIDRGLAAIYGACNDCLGASCSANALSCVTPVGGFGCMGFGAVDAGSRLLISIHVGVSAAHWR